MTQVFLIDGKLRTGAVYRGRGTHTLVCLRTGDGWRIVNVAETVEPTYGAQP